MFVIKKKVDTVIFQELFIYRICGATCDKTNLKYPCVTPCCFKPATFVAEGVPFLLQSSSLGSSRR